MTIARARKVMPNLTKTLTDEEVLSLLKKLKQKIELIYEIQQRHGNSAVNQS